MSSISALAQAFEQAMQVMEARREELNRADLANGNHGDNMVQIFQVASRAVQENDSLGEAMRHAANRLAGLGNNGSAQVYASGLHAFGEQFQQRQLNVDDLLGYLRYTLDKGEAGKPQETLPHAGDLLKALMNGLAEWRRSVNQSPDEARRDQAAGSGVDMGFLFELGAAYMAAKSRGGSRSAVVADAAVAASPLSQVDYRAESGKAAVQAILDSLGG